MCPCGRRTYLFGGCSKFIAEEGKTTLGEALDRLGEPEPDARDLGPCACSDPVAVAQRPRGEAEQLLLVTEEAVLRAMAAAEGEVEGLGGTEVPVVAWDLKVQLRLEPKRDHRRPFRWIGLVRADRRVLELQGCVSVSAKARHLFEGGSRPVKVVPGTNASVTEVMAKAIQESRELPCGRRHWL